jgi:hypothetical protein
VEALAGAACLDLAYCPWRASSWEAVALVHTLVGRGGVACEWERVRVMVIVNVWV